MSRICIICHEEKIASPDRKISEFTIQSINPRTGSPYYSSFCKNCASARVKARYVPVVNRKKPGKLSVVERNTELRTQIEQLLFEGVSVAAIARRTGVSVYTIHHQKKKGVLIARDHSSEEEQTESETESEESQDNESIAVEAEISDDE